MNHRLSVTVAASVTLHLLLIFIFIPTRASAPSPQFTPLTLEILPPRSKTKHMGFAISQYVDISLTFRPPEVRETEREQLSKDRIVGNVLDFYISDQPRPGLIFHLPWTAGR